MVGNQRLLALAAQWVRNRTASDLVGSGLGRTSTSVFWEAKVESERHKTQQIMLKDTLDAWCTFLSKPKCFGQCLT